jgi:hypothetical protein
MRSVICLGVGSLLFAFGALDAAAQSVLDRPESSPYSVDTSSPKSVPRLPDAPAGFVGESWGAVPLNSDTQTSVIPATQPPTIRRR